MSKPRLIFNLPRAAAWRSMYDWDMGDPGIDAVTHLRQAFEAMARYAACGLEGEPVTLNQLEILLLLDVAKVPLTASEIASYSFRELHTISEMLTRMEAEGYIRRIPSSEDRRKTEIQLQPEGQALLKRVKAGYGRCGRLLNSSMTQEELRQLDMLARKVRDCTLQELDYGLHPLPDILDWSRAIRPPDEQP